MIDEAMMLRECIYNLSGQDPQETKAIMQAAASKIDELRAALDKRDAEIEWLNKGWGAANLLAFKHAQSIDAQRNVLEQALEALTVADNISLLGSSYSIKAINKGFEKIRMSITAIQEQLNGQD